ncbi:MAG: threonylcarbamoyl-AMP synthase [Ichthyobacteriaceae bacterium]|nr:threonylcarbamoyl-AMP synthase [Ichthyobacteriaceae bacterium]
MAEIIRIYPENPNPKEIAKVVKVLQKGGVIIYPTDTVYGLGCDITKNKAMERVARIRGVKLAKAHFSFVCHDLSHLTDYTKQISNPIYKLLNRTLPGPFTFIMNGNNNLPKVFKAKKTVGIRIPDNRIALDIVKELGNPIISTSIHDEDEVIEYTTDPELIAEKYGNLVDIVIDGGYGSNVASTIVDITDEDNVVVVREGLGDLELI